MNSSETSVSHLTVTISNQYKKVPLWKNILMMKQKEPPIVLLKLSPFN